MKNKTHHRLQMANRSAVILPLKNMAIICYVCYSFLFKGICQQSSALLLKNMHSQAAGGLTSIL